MYRFGVRVHASQHTERLLNVTRFSDAATRRSLPTNIAVLHRDAALRLVSLSGVWVRRPDPSQPAHQKTVKPETLSARRRASFTAYHHRFSGPPSGFPFGVSVRRPGAASRSQPSSTPKDRESRRAFRAWPCILHHSPLLLYSNKKMFSARCPGPASRSGVRVPAEQHTQILLNRMRLPRTCARLCLPSPYNTHETVTQLTTSSVLSGLLHIH